MMECEMMLLKLTQILLCFEMFACVVAEGFQETYLQTVTVFTADQLSAKHSTKTLQTLQITIKCTKFEWNRCLQKPFDENYENFLKTTTFYLHVVNPQHYFNKHNQLYKFHHIAEVSKAKSLCSLTQCRVVFLILHLDSFFKLQ